MNGPIHVVVSWDSVQNKTNVYENGMLVDEYTMSSAMMLLADSAKLFLGKSDKNENSKYFYGTIHSLSIYDDVLSQDRIRNLYQNGTFAQNNRPVSTTKGTSDFLVQIERVFLLVQVRVKM